ncbi:MAG: hypothetical protein V4813_07395 [Gemmatimonadota bacterium]
MRLPRPTLALAALAALALCPSLAESQSTRDRDREDRRVRTVRLSFARRDRVPEREITMSVGALRSDDDDETLPMAALRTDWRLRNWLRSEVGVSYAIGSTERLEIAGVISPESRSLQIASATVGLRAELPARYLRPYVGVAAGLVMRAEEDGAQYVRTTMAFPTGLRFALSDRVSLRGEARWRFDQRRVGGQVVRVEQTGGLSVVF